MPPDFAQGVRVACGLILDQVLSYFPHLPDLEVVWKVLPEPPETLGWCSWGADGVLLLVGIYPGLDLASFLETLLHELTHAMLQDADHSSVFWSWMTEVAIEGYGYNGPLLSDGLLTHHLRQRVGSAPLWAL